MSINVTLFCQLLGLRLRVAREVAGYATAAAFCKAHGLQPVTYSRHEKGKSVMQVTMAAQYCEWLDVRLTWFMTGEGDPFEDKEKSDRALKLLEYLKASMKEATKWLHTDETN